MYYIYIIPYHLAFFIQKHFFQSYSKYYWTTLIISYICDIFIYIDYYLLYKIIPINDLINPDLLIWDQDKIKEYFLKYKFNIFDIILLLPIDLICLILYSASDNNNDNFIYIKLIIYFRIFKLLRIKIINTLFYKLNQYILYLKKITLNLQYISIIKICTLYFIFCHIYSCIWLYIAYELEKNQESWCTKYSIDILPNIHSQWIRSYYYTITTLSTIGYGDIRPINNLETSFELIVIFTGACLFASLIGLFANIFQYKEIYYKKNLYIKDINLLKKYINYKQFNYHIKNILLKYKYSYYQKFYKHQNYIKELPQDLRMDIIMYIHKNTLYHIKLFKDTKLKYIKKVLSYINWYTLNKNTYVYKRNDYGSEIYFISNGRCEETDELGLRLRIISSGGYFGHSHHNINNKRLYSIKVFTEYVDLLYLKVEHLHVIANHFPAFKNEPMYKVLVKHKQYKTDIKIKQQNKDHNHHMLNDKRYNVVNVPINLKDIL